VARDARVHHGDVRTVVVVAFDGLQLLDLAGPVEVLTAATFLGADPPYEIVIATPNGKPVVSQSGVQIAADASLDEVCRRRGSIHMLVVVGGLGIDDAVASDAVVHSLRTLSSRADRTTSVCSGALVLAAAGLLDGHRATTHWSECDRLAQDHPRVEVLADQIYVHDRDRWTSAGVTAGIDLFLALVEADHGSELAHAIAGWLVVFVRRPGGQTQFSAQLVAQPAHTPAIRQQQLWLTDHLTERHTVEALARRVGMSARNFARVFRAETGTTPAAYIEGLRIEAARRLLETTDLTIGAIAAAVGLHRPETLHRAFRRRVGTTPNRYREHFGEPVM
jgi:transcriptional regulator GlxA family with amidase domain